jgi:uncharacterized protein YndB with AHSA1/START domain
MTTPNVPLRLDNTFELPGTPEQVWEAIASANGITAWFLPTELEPREGGQVRFHMGEGAESVGSVTGWEPPGRLVYEEPDWAEMTGHAGSPVTPMVTEFLVQANSGGTCSLRVVTSAFGSGADWEQEFFEDMEKHWLPYFDNLRLYLTHFPGQQVTSMALEADVDGPLDAVWSAVRQNLGATEVGQPIQIRDVTGHVERIGTEIRELLVRIDGPVPGFLLFAAYEPGNDKARAAITGYLFSEAAARYVEQEKAGWKAWLEDLLIPVA